MPLIDLSGTKTTAPKDEPAYISWDDEKGRATAFKAVGAALQKAEPMMRSSASEIFVNIAPHNVGVRDGFNRWDYQFFRRDEAIPTRSKDIIRICMAAYHNVGIIRNVIDLMADFGSQGVKLTHENESVQNFYQAWFKKVSGVERSERFLNLLYRTANVIIKRQGAKLSKEVEDEINRSRGASKKIEIPWSYTFLNPLTIELFNEELAPLVGPDQFLFGIKLPDTIAQKIKHPRTSQERQMVNKLPSGIRESVHRGDKLIVLKPEETAYFYYKRDDWQPWAFPMVHSILADINLLQKMKLADLCALDGAISNIRVWKLGDVKEKILPSETTILRLSQILSNNVGGGVMDLVWGPDLELIETKTDVHNFLGETKYGPVLTAIYTGLGIPPTMVGHGTNGGFTTNFISLKTLTERLEYGRSVLQAFWEKEIRLVQEAMNFRKPAQLTFDHMVLSDEAAEKNLLINLADRGFLSLETLQERFGEIPEIEQIRMRREDEKRKTGELSQQYGPFVEGQQEYNLKKIFTQLGTTTPGEMGINLGERKEGEISPQEFKAEEAIKQAKLKGQPGQGRPVNSKDSKKRKQKSVKVRTSAFFQDMTIATTMQERISDIITPFLLKSLGKSNMRQLTEAEASDFEKLKFSILCNTPFLGEINEKSVGEMIQKSLPVPDVAHKLLWDTVSEYTIANKKAPPTDILRRFQAATYAAVFGSDGMNDESWVDDLDNPVL